jgi:exopolysaccharide biosynthesis polyprenyl glycosylphosphotransferase
MRNRTVQTAIACGFVVCDVLALSLAFVLAYGIRIRLTMFIQVQPWSSYFLPVAVLIGLCLLVFQQQGLYREVRDLTLVEEYAKLIKGLTYAFLLALALTFFLKVYERSRVLIVLYWVLAAGFLILARFILYSWLQALRARGRDQQSVALIGTDRKIRAIRHLLLQHKQLGYAVKAELALPRGTSLRGEAWRKALEHEILARYRRGEIDGVIISDSVKNYPRILETNEILQEQGIPHRSVTEAFDVSGLKTAGGEEFESLLASLDEGQPAGGYKVAKRVMDEVFTILFLLLSLPVWLIIMLAIKLDSPGPVFFRQERVGYLGRRFRVFKFRTMHRDSPHYAKTPRSPDDPRITRVGAFLRRTSLDELPQFFNVLKGDMSLVGPRPEMPFVVDTYKAIYRFRLLVKPGLTGLWQVSGRTDKPLEENIKYDLYYIKNQSLLLDLVILLRTVPAVWFGKGAY